MNYQRRRGRLLDSLPSLTVDALLVTRLTNIRYLTGFTGTTAFLLLGEEPIIAVDFRYRDQVKREVAGIEVLEVASARELWPAVLRLLDERGHPRLGIEASTLTTANYLELLSSNGREIVPTQSVVERLRYQKDAEEIDAIRRAIAITDEAMNGVLELIRPGMTEHEVAGEIERLQRTMGGERSASEIIVASGPRSAMPHGIASERIIGQDEPVMFDLGTVVDGYLADLTRTIHIGPASKEFRRIYQVVLDAQARAEEGIKPGMRASDADALARDHIVASGYGNYFGHSLGHSIGLDNHETPALSPFDDTTLEPGMVVTVEPGIYLPGREGVRTEDVVVITEDGCEVLTGAAKALVEL